MRLRLTALIFSGRPDPFWQVAGSQADALVRRLKGLRPCRSDPVQTPDLGYRGLRIEMQGLFGASGGTWQVFCGQAVRAGRVFEDPGRALELMGIDTARAHLDPELFATLQQAVRNGVR